MYVKVRTMDGLQTAVLSISKLTSITEFRALVKEKLNAPPDRQRLFFSGKQLEDGHKLFDYNVNVNDVIQLMIKPILNEVTNQKTEKENLKLKYCEKTEAKNNIKESEPYIKSEYYKVGDKIDAKSLCDNAWWEAFITKLATNKHCKEKTEKDDGLFYYVKFERYLELADDEIKLEHIRPRARCLIPLEKLNINDTVMVNYSFENPEERGYWYDFNVKQIINERKKKVVVGSILLSDKNIVENCHIYLVNEIFKIEKNVKLKEEKINLKSEIENVPDKRKSGVFCPNCKDVKDKNCKECGCCICGGKKNPEKQLMCDECDQCFHIYCLKPPLEKIPDDDEWFCPLCKNDDSEIVRAGEKLKRSKKKENMMSAKNKGNKRDWGKGFACASRQKICTLVPSDHFGPIPGVEVGSLWMYRLMVSEAGVHRPHVAGIHGRENIGAFSIVLAGGYEDDEDRGEEFTYTGSGGRDLSGNRRTAGQSCDQKLTRMNRALAVNCNAPINKEGAEAVDWKKGKPVRVVRNYKGSKHSTYAPKEGNRYDGIYKVVKYWQDVGKSGFKVWRYLFRRDDNICAPWTPEGEERIKKLGLTMQYPEGYLEAKEELNDKGKNDHSESDEEEIDNKKSRKRTSLAQSGSKCPYNPPKKSKTALEYEIEDELLGFIENDVDNEKVWSDCKEAAKNGKAAFLSCLEDRFSCVCCQMLVCRPITTSCLHNVCESCLRRSFKANVYSCPSCRHDLGKKVLQDFNENLQKALQFSFPGYDQGR